MSGPSLVHLARRRLACCTLWISERG